MLSPQSTLERDWLVEISGQGDRDLRAERSLLPLLLTCEIWEYSFERSSHVMLKVLVSKIKLRTINLTLTA